MSQTQPLLDPTALTETVTAVCQGNKDAFHTLLTAYSGLVYGYVLRQVQQKELAEELTQEIFIRVYQNLDKYDTKRPFKPWLMRIASNWVTNHFRYTVSRPQLWSPPKTDEEGHDPLSRLTDNNQKPDEHTENQLIGDTLDKALSHLQPNYRQVILLRHRYDYPFQTIAEILEIPESTAKTWYRRSRDKLKTIITEQYSWLIPENHLTTVSAFTE